MQKWYDCIFHVHQDKHSNSLMEIINPKWRAYIVLDLQEVENKNEFEKERG